MRCGTASPAKLVSSFDQSRPAVKAGPRPDRDRASGLRAAFYRLRTEREFRRLGSHELQPRMAPLKNYPSTITLCILHNTTMISNINFFPVPAFELLARAAFKKHFIVCAVVCGLGEINREWPNAAFRSNGSKPKGKLLSGVKAALERLGPLGWEALLEHHGLDLSADDLAHELSRPLPRIDRSFPGFEDFAHEGNRGVEPGAPARNLLFSAFASPRITSFRHRGRLTKLKGFPPSRRSKRSRTRIRPSAAFDRRSARSSPRGPLGHRGLRNRIQGGSGTRRGRRRPLLWPIEQGLRPPGQARGGLSGDPRRWLGAFGFGRYVCVRLGPFYVH